MIAAGLNVSIDRLEMTLRGWATAYELADRLGRYVMRRCCKTAIVGQFGHHRPAGERPSKIMMRSLPRILFFCGTAKCDFGVARPGAAAIFELGDKIGSWLCHHKAVPLSTGEARGLGAASGHHYGRLLIWPVEQMTVIQPEILSPIVGESVRQQPLDDVNSFRLERSHRSWGDFVEHIQSTIDVYRRVRLYRQTSEDREARRLRERGRNRICSERQKAQLAQKIGIPGAYPVFKEMALALGPFLFTISDRLLGQRLSLGYQVRAPGCFKENNGFLEIGQSGQMNLRMPTKLTVAPEVASQEPLSSGRPAATADLAASSMRRTRSAISMTGRAFRRSSG